MSGGTLQVIITHAFIGRPPPGPQEAGPSNWFEPTTANPHNPVRIVSIPRGWLVHAEERITSSSPDTDVK